AYAWGGGSWPSERWRRRIDHAVVVGERITRLREKARTQTLGQHRCAPRVPVAFETVEDVLVAVLEIRTLARVLHHIEQELVAGHVQIFPVTVAHRALRSGFVAPVEFARMRRRSAGERCSQI